VIEGNYDTYQHFVRQGLAREARSSVAAKSDQAPKAGQPGAGLLPAKNDRTAKERKKRKYPYRKAAEIEHEIAQREARIREVHELFGSEEVLRDGARVKQLSCELAEHEQELPRLYEHWEEATELNS
jgi:ATP-binding cassette subfamily F protein 3